MYTATVIIMGKKYTGTGDTVSGALQNIEFKGKPAGKAILSVSHGDRTRERVLNYAQTFRLFNGSPLMKEVAVKNFSLLFDGV